MSHSKNALAKYGINEAYFSQITGRPVRSFRIKPVHEGYNVHSDLYCFTLTFSDGSEPLSIFAKDTYMNRDVSGRHEKDGQMNQTEAEFLEFATHCKAFTPRYLGSINFTDKKEQKHLMLFMEKYNHSLEDKLIALKAQRDRAGSEEERQAIVDQAFDYIRRAIDIIVVNNYIARRSFNPEDPSSAGNKLRVMSPPFQEYHTDLEDYLTGLTLFKLLNDFKQKKDKRFEVVKKGLAIMRDYVKRVEEVLDEFIANELTGNSSEHELTHLDTLPGHVLLKDVELGDYDPNTVLDLRTGRNGGSTPYDGFAITDYNKFGYAPDGFFAAILLNHPAIFQIMPADREKQLVEHALVQEERLRTANSAIQLTDIRARDVQNFMDVVYQSGGRYALLRNIGFMAWLCMENPTKARNLQKRNLLYTPETFIKANLDRLFSVDVRGFYPLNEWLEKKVLSEVNNNQWKA